jgi:hypothetical protein
MVMISESLKLKLELLRTKATLELLTRAEPLLSTVSELLLSTLAWSETYSWYLEISLEELESRLVKDEPTVTPHNTWGTYLLDCEWTPLDD